MNEEMDQATKDEMAQQLKDQNYILQNMSRELIG